MAYVLHYSYIFIRGRLICLMVSQMELQLGRIDYQDMSTARTNCSSLDQLAAFCKASRIWPKRRHRQQKRRRSDAGSVAVPVVASRAVSQLLASSLLVPSAVYRASRADAPVVAARLAVPTAKSERRTRSCAALQRAQPSI